MGEADAFFEFATQLADGDRWKVARSEGWEDFQEKLAEVVGNLPVRRRQALMMVMFCLIEEIVSPADLRAWMGDHDIGNDAGIEDLIGWLRERRSAAG